jgi:hypothetical protein
MSTVNEFGVSSYPQIWDQYDAATKTLDMGQSARAIDLQLRQFAGLSIAGLRDAHKRFIFNEVGIGGCEKWGCAAYSDRAVDIYDLSVNAYNGLGSFNEYTDDSINYDPFYRRWALAFKEEWWRALLTFLSGHSKSDNPEFVPDAAYVWTVGSWDIAAIYHGSSVGLNPDGVGCDPLKSYCDPTILKMVKAYNAKCIVPKKPFFSLPGPDSCRPQTMLYGQQVCTPEGTARQAPQRARNVDPDRIKAPRDTSKVPAEAVGAMFTRTRVD